MPYKVGINTELVNYSSGKYRIRFPRASGHNGLSPDQYIPSFMSISV